MVASRLALRSCRVRLRLGGDKMKPRIEMGLCSVASELNRAGSGVGHQAVRPVFRDSRDNVYYGALRVLARGEFYAVPAVADDCGGFLKTSGNYPASKKGDG